MAFQIQPGHTYKLTNNKTRVVLNLSMADFKSVAGATWDGSDNQKVHTMEPSEFPVSLTAILTRCSGWQNAPGQVHNLVRRDGSSEMWRQGSTSGLTVLQSPLALWSLRGLRRNGTYI